VEAAAHARAVVAFNTGGVSDWLEDRKGGFLVQRLNCRAFALRLERLAYNASDRVTMGLKHREAARARHDKDRHIARLMEIYKELSG
jgi:glycosyltransferase involved in cell wall biosynthesis